MIAACLRSTHVSTVPKQEQHGDRVADEDGGDDEVLDHARAPRFPRRRSREQRLGIDRPTQASEAGGERAHDTLEVRVMAAALRLDAQRDEHVGVRVLGLQYALRKTMFAPAGMRAKSKPSPHTTTRSVSLAKVNPVVVLREQRPRRGRVRDSCRRESADRHRARSPAAAASPT
jgi:hypothetical protein